MRCSPGVIRSVRQGSHKTDGAVSAHAETAYIIKEDNSGGTRGIDRVTQEGANHHVGTAWLVHNRAAKTVVLLAKALQALGQWPRAEIGSAANNQSRRLATGVGVDHSYSAGLSVHHLSLILSETLGWIRPLVEVQVEIVAETRERHLISAGQVKTEPAGGEIGSGQRPTIENEPCIPLL